jgi:hypothetical protein
MCGDRKISIVHLPQHLVYARVAVSPEALGKAFACVIAITNAVPGTLLTGLRCRSRSRIPLRGAMLMLLRLHFPGYALLRSIKDECHTAKMHRGDFHQRFKGRNGC